MKAWNIREEWATDRERWKGLFKTRYSAQRDGGEGEKVMQKDASLNFVSLLNFIYRSSLIHVTFRRQSVSTMEGLNITRSP